MKGETTAHNASAYRLAGLLRNGWCWCLWGCVPAALGACGACWLRCLLAAVLGLASRGLRWVRRRVSDRAGRGLVGGRWRVSAHRGPRQLRRRWNAANGGVVGEQRGREASVRCGCRQALPKQRRDTCAKGPRSPATTPLAARSPRKGCRGPRWAETRFSSHSKCADRQGGLGLGSQARPARRGWKPPVRQPRHLSAAPRRARGGRRNYGTRGIRAVQAGFRRTASRRAEPQPALPQRTCRPGTPAAQRRAISAAAKQRNTSQGSR